MSDTTSTAPIVKCPTCGGPSVFEPANASRPFCSKRCKDIDLGAWAAEEFRVPTQPPQENPYDALRTEQE